MDIAVGSKNPVKIQAVKQAFNRLFPHLHVHVMAYAVCSAATDQPIGMDQILHGATHRAAQVRELCSHSNFDPSSPHPEYYVGIEAGFVPLPDTRYLNFQFCVIQDNEGHETIGSGSGLSFPPTIIKRLIADRTLELADLMASISHNADIKHQEGAVGFYSQGLINRLEITQQSVEMALIPFKSKEHYFSSK